MHQPKNIKKIESCQCGRVMTQKISRGHTYHVCPHCGRKKGLPFAYAIGDRPGMKKALNNILHQIKKEKDLKE